MITKDPWWQQSFALSPVQPEHSCASAHLGADPDPKALDKTLGQKMLSNHNILHVQPLGCQDKLKNYS